MKENKKTLPNWVFVIDLNTCVGCNACMAACAQENQSPYWAKKWRTKVDQAEVGVGDNVGRIFFPRLCMHCQNTPCYYACPTGATYKTPEGVVMVNQDLCIGCEACVIACPYDARYRYESEDVEQNKKLY
ncbi:MAG TPA: 4Fe-4S dicluster domain-containing protein, partial [Aquificales bacterium]|nr:4Fe-4S dicluster domain-containing protein [Aquificales bacterium]